MELFTRIPHTLEFHSKLICSLIQYKKMCIYALLIWIGEHLAALQANPSAFASLMTLRSAQDSKHSNKASTWPRLSTLLHFLYNTSIPCALCSSSERHFNMHFTVCVPKNRTSLTTLMPIVITSQQWWQRKQIVKYITFI